MRVSAIIQARMGSTRLPGKVLMNVGGATVLSRVVSRTQSASLIHEVVVATTSLPCDSVIVEECGRLGVRSFRGSESDVLDRYYRCAEFCETDVIVRITSDCPLIDPQLVDATVDLFRRERADYASNVAPRRYPRGLDVEVFSRPALEQARQESTEPYEREHVTPYFYQHPDWFHLASLIGSIDYSDHRWTLDTPEDLQLLRAIYLQIGHRDNFTWEEVVAVVERDPELAAVNKHVIQKSFHG